MESEPGSLQMVSEPKTALFSGGGVYHACSSLVEGHMVRRASALIERAWETFKYRVCSGAQVPHEKRTSPDLGYIYV